MQTEIYMVGFLHSLDKSHHEEAGIQEMVDNSDSETSECLEEPTVHDDVQNGSAQSYVSGAEIFEAKATMLDNAHPTTLKIWKPIEGVAWSEKYYEAGITFRNGGFSNYLA